MTDKNNGLVAGLQTTFPIAMFMSALLSIALFSVIELNLQIFFTFKRWRGLYFWSLFISTWGIAFNCVGYILKFFQVTTANFFSSTLILIGWTCMVNGQSLVLYSRIHLVVHDHQKVRGVLGLIVTNFVICCVPVWALVYGVNSKHPDKYVKPYDIYECVQLTIFALQEVFISGLYIYYTARMLGPTLEFRGKSKSAVMTHLIYINVILIILDIVIVSLQYAGLYSVQTSLKAAVYGIKLKLEFHILNHLLHVTQKNGNNTGNHTGNQSSHQSKLSRHAHSSTVESKGDFREAGPSDIALASGDTVKLTELQNLGVLRTTEVIVESEEYPRKVDNEESGVPEGSVGTHSPSSSVRHLAVPGF